MIIDTKNKKITIDVEFEFEQELIDFRNYVLKLDGNPESRERGFLLGHTILEKILTQID